MGLACWRSREGGPAVHAWFHPGRKRCTNGIVFSLWTQAESGPWYAPDMFGILPILQPRNHLARTPGQQFTRHAVRHRGAIVRAALPAGADQSAAVGTSDQGVNG